MICYRFKYYILQKKKETTNATNLPARGVRCRYSYLKE